MSLTVTLVDGEIDSRFVGIPIEGVKIGTYEIPLEHFSYMAMHFLGGGFFGWGGETPKCVNDALTSLFNLYAKAEDGKWIRKTVEELAKGSK